MTRTILVTGATGRLGTAVCVELQRRGLDVRGSDLRYERGFPVPLQVGDLRDEAFVYRLMEGCIAVVHLGNHPNQFVGPSPQRLLADNVAMNANVFHAACDLGVESILFASSVQAMIKREKQVAEPPYAIPYLPLDGKLPCNPGRNTYAQSKEFAERMLRLLAEAEPRLSVTALRFPMLVTEPLARRMRGSQPILLSLLDYAECTAHLFLPDAARLVAALLERPSPGYRQYFPALAMELRGYSVGELLRDRYPDVEVRQPIREFADLIDISEIRRELDWEPVERLCPSVTR